MGRPKKTAVSKNKTVRRRSETRNISNARSRLDIESIKGFKTRWVNDVGTNMHKMTVEDDWDFVTESDYPNFAPQAGDDDIQNVDLVGSKISRPVGKVGEIDNAVAYLLKKPVEFFNEDYAKLAASITKQEQAIKRPNDLANSTGEIKIR